MKWNVNLLGLVAAIVGIGAIFSQWIGGWLADYNLIDVINALGSDSGYQDYLFASVVVVLGAVMALLSPVGGFLEIAGAFWFILTWASDHDGEIVSSIGPYLAVASGIIAIVSIVKPVGLGYGQTPIGFKDRVLIFSRPSSRVALEAGSPSKPAWAEKFCEHCGRPMAGEATRCPGCGAKVEEPNEAAGEDGEKTGQVPGR